MCREQHQNTLSETTHGRITWCQCCKKHSLIFHTSCAVFEHDELYRFAEMLANLKVRDFDYTVKREDCVLLKNHCSTVGLCLRMDQVIELSELIQKALLIHEAYRLVGS